MKARYARADRRGDSRANSVVMGMLAAEYDPGTD